MPNESLDQRRFRRVLGMEIDAKENDGRGQDAVSPRPAGEEDGERDNGTVPRCDAPSSPRNKVATRIVSEHDVRGFHQADVAR